MKLRIFIIMNRRLFFTFIAVVLTSGFRYPAVISREEWACPACFRVADDSGNCDVDKTPRVEMNSWFCPVCLKATRKKADCTHCHKPALKMTKKLCQEYQSKQRES